MSEEQQPGSKKKLIRILVIAFLLLAGLAVAGYFIYRHINSPYTSFEEIHRETVVTGSGTVFFPYLEGYIRVSRDGTEAVDSDGLSLWNISYSMNNPEAAICGSYVSVADIGGIFVYVTDGKGNSKKVELPWAVQEIECSRAGVTAVRMNDGEDDYIRFVDLEGETLVDIKTVEDCDGFPVDMALSPDGKKLVTSYLIIDGDSTAGQLTFYNFGKVGKNYSNSVTGIFRTGHASPKISFIGSGDLCAFFDDGLDFYSVSEVPSEGKHIAFEGRVLHAFVSDEGVIVMKESMTSGIVSETQAFDGKGNSIFESRSTDELSGVMFYGKRLLFYNEYACQILNRDGTLAFNGNFGAEMSNICPVNTRDRLLFFTGDEAVTIRLTKGNDR